MDKSTCAFAVIGAAAASLVFGGVLGPRAPAELPATMPVSAAAPPAVVSADCERARMARNEALPAVPPTGPSDRQFNAAGTGVAGAAGTVPDQARGDPCAPVRRADEPRTQERPAGPDANERGRTSP